MGQKGRIRWGVVIAYALSACGDGGFLTAPGSEKTKVVPPAAPRISEVISASRHLLVEFVPPENDGGAPITAYAYSADNGVTWTVSQAAVAVGSVSIDDLENGKTYSIGLRAINSAGPGAAVLATGTPTTTPSQVKILEILPGDKTLRVSFAIPDSGGHRITGYAHSLDAGAHWSEPDSTMLSSPIVIGGLVNGTAYFIQIRAVNAAGNGGSSEAVAATPMTIPSAPAIDAVTAGLDKLTVSVTPSDDGGSEITGYQYSLDGGNQWVASTNGNKPEFEITGLTWEVEYSVRARAVNKMGPGAASKPATGTPLGLPAPPVLLRVLPADGELLVEFALPVHTGGRPLLGFEYSLDSGVTWSAAAIAPTETKLLVTGLSNGDTYDLALRSVTSSGKGSVSNVIAGMPFVVSPRVDTLRAVRHPQENLYIPQMLDDRDPTFDLDLERALQRYRTLHGRDAVTLFEKVQAAADYVANMAKHPFRHELSTELSDPRTWEFLDLPASLAELSRENQMWIGSEWVPAEGKTLADVPAVECTFQDFILGGLVNALGAQWMLIGITHHDAFTYYDNEIGKWVYIESTFNEHYRSASSSADDYVPLSPLELREMSLAGDNSMVAVQHPYQPRRAEKEYYIGPYVLMHPLGFRAMMADVNGISKGERHSLGRDLRVLPGGTSENDYRDFIAGGWELADPTEDIWAPQGETFVESLVSTPRGNVIRLFTNLAVASVIFERKVGDGAWTVVDSESELDGLVGTIRFRARSGGIVAGQVIITQAEK